MKRKEEKNDHSMLSGKTLPSLGKTTCTNFTENHKRIVHEDEARLNDKNIAVNTDVFINKPINKQINLQTN